MGYHPSLGFDIATGVMIGHMLRSPHRHHHQARAGWSLGGRWVARRRGGGGSVAVGWWRWGGGSVHARTLAHVAYPHAACRTRACMETIA
eukprot:709914-Prymnesium_polylepis.1